VVVLVAGVVVVVVGVVVEVLVDVEVDVDVFVLLAGVVVVVVVVVFVVEVLVLGLVELVPQSRCASTPTVLAPWRRFVRSVGLTVTGRLVTVCAKAATARDATPQLPALTAEETESSWLFRLAD
jgi:hypothetical protein